MELAWNYLAKVGSWVKAANQTQTGVSIEVIEEQTRVLAKEFVYLFAKNAEPQSPIGIRMRDCVDRVSKEYGVQFDAMLSMINLGKENAVETLLNIASRLYEREGNCNWGRVITTFTFAGLVARKLALQEGGDECFLDVFATAFGNHLVNTISQWIFKQGGWDTFPSTTAACYFGNFGTIICLGFGVAVACTYTALR